MTSADQGQPGTASQWLTLTEAATHSGYSRDAIRQRIRRGKLQATKGNDGQLRVQARDLDDLPPPDLTADDQGQPGDKSSDLALDVLQATVADLRTTVNDLGQQLEKARTALDMTQADRLNDRGRAERAEAQAVAESARAATAEARALAAEAALVEARTPLLVRVIRAVRGR